MTSLRSESAAPTKQARLFYLDWLRVLAVFAVFWYHTFRPFDITDWHVKNSQQSVVIPIVITIIIMAFGLWGMPLFFVLAGAAPIPPRALPASPRAVARASIILASIVLWLEG